MMLIRNEHSEGAAEYAPPPHVSGLFSGNSLPATSQRCAHEVSGVSTTSQAGGVGGFELRLSCGEPLQAVVTLGCLENMISFVFIYSSVLSVRGTHIYFNV